MQRFGEATAITRLLSIGVVQSRDREAWLYPIYEGHKATYIYQYKYGWMPSARIRVNSHLRPYETPPSPAIQDIIISCHTRHHHLWPYETPSPAIEDSSPAETCICNRGCGQLVFVHVMISQAWCHATLQCNSTVPELWHQRQHRIILC